MAHSQSNPTDGAWFPSISCQSKANSKVKFVISTDTEKTKLKIEMIQGKDRLWRKAKTSKDFEVLNRWQVDAKKSSIKNVDDLFRELSSGKANFMTGSGGLEIDLNSKVPSLWFHDETHELTGCFDASDAKIVPAKTKTDARAKKVSAQDANTYNTGSDAITGTYDAPANTNGTHQQ